MTKENIQMVVAVAVLLLLSFVDPSADTNLEPETAIITESINVEDVAETAEKDQANEPTPEAGDEVSYPTDSFDESALEEESGNVQKGIDLLNNPLQ